MRITGGQWWTAPAFPGFREGVCVLVGIGETRRTKWWRRRSLMVAGAAAAFMSDGSARWPTVRASYGAS
jgi:hypothetical protein